MHCYIWHVCAIPTYRVYRLCDTKNMHMGCSLKFTGISLGKVPEVAGYMHSVISQESSAFSLWLWMPTKTCRRPGHNRSSRKSILLSYRNASLQTLQYIWCSASTPKLGHSGIRIPPKCMASSHQLAGGHVGTSPDGHGVQEVLMEMGSIFDHSVFLGSSDAHPPSNKHCVFLYLKVSWNATVWY